MATGAAGNLGAVVLLLHAAIAGRPYQQINDVAK
jgi:hypothetical protein